MKNFMQYLRVFHTLTISLEVLLATFIYTWWAYKTYTLKLLKNEEVEQLYANWYLHPCLDKFTNLLGRPDDRFKFCCEGHYYLPILI